jgi:DNA-binding response OmpR family regulator
MEAQQAVVLEACQTKSSRIQVKALLLERDSKSTTFDGQSIDLTDLEFEILWVLAEQAGRVVSSIRLLSQVWGLQHDPQSNRVAVYVKRLRGKLPEGLIQTQRGKGYRLQI